MIRVYQDLIYVENVIFDISLQKLIIPGCYQGFPIDFKKSNPTLFKMDKNIHKYTSDLFPTYEVINQPIILYDGIDQCYSHVIYDDTFPLYVAMHECNKYFFNSEIQEYELMLVENKLEKLNLEAKEYKQRFCNDFPKLISNKIRISVLQDKNLFIKQCIIYPSDDKWQRSVWNNQTIYEERHVPLSEVRCSDEYLMSLIRKYRNMIMTKYDKDLHKQFDKINLILLDRLDDRHIYKNILDYFLASFSKLQEKYPDKFQFNGVKYLENMTLEEQITLFNSNNCFIFEHGSAEANLLFAPEKSHIFEYDSKITRKNIYGKICEVINSNHYYLPVSQHQQIIRMIEIIIQKNM